MNEGITMAEKKQGDLSVLLGYAGSHKALTIIGCVLSVIAMLMGMAPYSVAGCLRPTVQMHLP